MKLAAQPCRARNVGATRMFFTDKYKSKTGKRTKGMSLLVCFREVIVILQLTFNNHACTDKAHHIIKARFLKRQLDACI